MSAVQLSFDGPVLPPAFVERWRALEREAGAIPATLEAKACVFTRGRWWLALKVNGRKWARIKATGDVASLADDIWKARLS